MGTWNVRSLHQMGKLENVMQEMSQMNIDILRTAETFWEGTGDFEATLPETKEQFRIIFSGSAKKRKGVAFIMRGIYKDSVKEYDAVSDRIIGVRLNTTPVEMNIIQVYAPTSDAELEVIDRFYEDIENIVKASKKFRDCLVIMGDFNGKVGEIKEDDVVGPFGLDQKNEQGQRIVECSRNLKLILANTWFQTRRNSRHTWTAPDGKTKNQIDYIFIDKRYRNGVRNCKARQDRDCGSDHNPVLAYLNIKLQKMSNNRGTALTSHWNTELLKTDNTKPVSYTHLTLPTKRIV